MSRKVHVDAEVEVLLPVKVRVRLFMVADDNASIAKAVTAWVKCKNYGGADVQDSSVEIVDRNGYTDDIPLCDIIHESLDNGVGSIKAKVMNIEVTDSR